MSKKKTKEQLQGGDLTDALEKEKRAWKITGCKRAGIRALYIDVRIKTKMT